WASRSVWRSALNRSAGAGFRDTTNGGRVKADEIRELFVYNAWANRRMFDALAALPAEQYHRDLKCSFASIHGTLAHIVGAEQLWMARWRGRQPPTLLKGGDVGSLAEVRTSWEGSVPSRPGFLGEREGAWSQSRAVRR